MKDNDVSLISEKFGIEKEIVEAAAEEGTLGQRIMDATKDQIVYKKDDFEIFKTNLKAETVNSYYAELVEKAKKADIPQELYAPIKGAAYQQLERDISKKTDITDYKDVSDLIDKVITSAKTKGVNPDAEKVINDLKQANLALKEEKENAVKLVTDEFNNKFLNKEKQSLLNSIPFDFTDVKQDELENKRSKTQTLLKSVFDAEYKLGYNDKNSVIVMDKEGKVLTNPATLEPLPAQDVLVNLAKEYNLKLTSPDSGGQGGTSSAQSSAAFTDRETFFAYCKANGINPMEKEGIDLWRKAGINNK